MVVLEGVTICVPLGGTVPIPWSIEIVTAPTTSQLRVIGVPGAAMIGEMRKLMLGGTPPTGRGIE